jgi:hypothetical protein
MPTIAISLAQTWFDPSSIDTALTRGGQPDDITPMMPRASFRFPLKLASANPQPQCASSQEAIAITPLEAIIIRMGEGWMRRAIQA